MIDRPAPAETDDILRLIERAGVFTATDVECVRELLEDHFGRPDRTTYEFRVYRLDGRIAGMICYGPTPLTSGTFDLYWLAVGPEVRRRGVAQSLVADMEGEIRRRGARLLVVETSSSPEYQPAREFYLASGFQRQATIPDFYLPGDDLVVYTKRFN